VAHHSLVVLAAIAPAQWWAYSSAPNDRAPSARTQRVARTVVPFLLVFSLCGYLFLRDEMWVPREVVGLRSGEAVDGYVLAADTGTLRIMREKDRAVIQVSASDVVSRSICTKSTDGWWKRPPIALFWPSPKYHKCPDSSRVTARCRRVVGRASRQRPPNRLCRVPTSNRQATSLGWRQTQRRLTDDFDLDNAPPRLATSVRFHPQKDDAAAHPRVANSFE
jgi:hypothetical protein